MNLIPVRQKSNTVLSFKRRHSELACAPNILVNSNSITILANSNYSYLLTILINSHNFEAASPI